MGRWVWPILLCLGLPCTLWAHTDLDRRQAEHHAETPWPEPPPILGLRLSALGYRYFAADMMWLATVQYYGAHRNIEDGHFRLMVPIVERVVALDPLFEYAYRFAGTTAVGPEGQNLEAVTRLLERGEAALPDVWRLPYIRASNCLQYDGPSRCVAEGFKAATKVKGSPEWLTLLAGRAMTAEGHGAEAFDLLARLAEHTKDPMLKLRVQDRLADMQLEADMASVAAALERYRARLGDPEGCPEGLDALLDDQLLTVPEHPSGGVYQLDSDCRLVQGLRGAKKP